MRKGIEALLTSEARAEIREKLPLVRCGNPDRRFRISSVATLLQVAQFIGVSCSAVSNCRMESGLAPTNPAASHSGPVYTQIYIEAMPWEGLNH